jgi:protein involved in polysaccharide export with SLBB domain
MFFRLLRQALPLTVLLVAASTARAQNPLPTTPPTPAQAQQMLKNDPGLAARLQQMLRTSGMTPDQVRERLRAQGYPEALLDQYLPGARADSAGVPSEDVFNAVRALGIADSAMVDSLAASVRNRGRMRSRLDSAFLDTLEKALRNDTTASAIRSLLRSRELQHQMLDSGFKVYGLDLFSRETNLFSAERTGAVDASYRLGPGDRLVLFLTGDVEKSYTLDVTREGFVVIPDVGTVNVSGLTRTQLEDALFSRLARVYSGVRRGPGATTRFYVDISQIGANQIFVNGDVQHPASYRVSRAGTVMTALYQAGGPTANGSMRTVQVRRNGQTITTLDVYDYALHGDASHDIRLENGDIVFVPPRGQHVRIAGNVLRPATYEIRATETLKDVVQLAGGFTEDADTRTIQIERIVPPLERTTAGSDRRMIDVPSDSFATAAVRGGDIIRVREVTKRVSNRVNVRGDVWTPSHVAFTNGMTLYDALRRVGGLKPDAYLGQVLVSRLQPDSSRRMLRTALFDTTGHPVDNLPLVDGDEITVFSVTEFRPERFISVQGAVRRQGQIPYREGMTLQDAVLIAGGLREGASLTDAEIARLPENRAAGVTAQRLIVSLDSSYLFERRGAGTSSIQGPSTLLQPYDAILIKRQPEWQLQQTVMIAGEVRFPGPYSLVRKTEKLSDIIARAGGLTAAAYPEGITFVRSRDTVGRIGVDLPRVLRDTTYIDNLQLVDGDSIFIPRYTSVVTVRGAVNSPVGVAYVRGADLDYYVRSAGGVNTKGDGGRAYVTQPNGKVDAKQKHMFGYTSVPKPQPGSTVTVPEKDPLDKRDWLQVATAFTSILGSLVAISAIVRR